MDFPCVKENELSRYDKKIEGILHSLLNETNKFTTTCFRKCFRRPLTRYDDSSNKYIENVMFSKTIFLFSAYSLVLSNVMNMFL